MDSIISSLRDLSILTVVLRILLAALAGGAIGLEREFHGRAAGLRTHMLVSIAASLTALIGVFLVQELHLNSDVQRTGAQVMSGIGFLGAGTILLKRGSSHITGLTTAAGLWATAAVGLASGYGFYEGAIITALLVVIAFTVMSKVEFFMSRKRQRAFFYIEIDSVDAVREFLETLSTGFEATEMQVTPARSGIPPHIGLEALIRIPQKDSADEIIGKLYKLDHVLFALQMN